MKVSAGRFCITNWIGMSYEDAPDTLSADCLLYDLSAVRPRLYANVFVKGSEISVVFGSDCGFFSPKGV